MAIPSLSDEVHCRNCTSQNKTFAPLVCALQIPLSANQAFPVRYVTIPFRNYSSHFITFAMQLNSPARRIKAKPQLCVSLLVFATAVRFRCLTELGYSSTELGPSSRCFTVPFLFGSFLRCCLYLALLCKSVSHLCISSTKHFGAVLGLCLSSHLSSVACRFIALPFLCVTWPNYALALTCFAFPLRCQTLP